MRVGSHGWWWGPMGGGGVRAINKAYFRDLTKRFDRPRADRGQWRKSRSDPFSTSRWVLTDRGRTEDSGVKVGLNLFPTSQPWTVTSKS